MSQNASQSVSNETNSQALSEKSEAENQTQPFESQEPVDFLELSSQESLESTQGNKGSDCENCDSEDSAASQKSTVSVVSVASEVD